MPFRWMWTRYVLPNNLQKHSGLCSSMMVYCSIVDLLLFGPNTLLLPAGYIDAYVGTRGVVSHWWREAIGRPIWNWLETKTQIKRHLFLRISVSMCNRGVRTRPVYVTALPLPSWSWCSLSVCWGRMWPVGQNLAATKKILSPFTTNNALSLVCAFVSILLIMILFFRLLLAPTSPLSTSTFWLLSALGSSIGFAVSMPLLPILLLHQHIIHIAISISSSSFFMPFYRLCGPNGTPVSISPLLPALASFPPSHTSASSPRLQLHLFITQTAVMSANLSPFCVLT